MDTQEQQVALLVRRIDGLKRSREQHWKDARNAIEEGNLNQAITLLNAYFFLEDELIMAEGQLKGILKGRYTDR